MLARWGTTHRLAAGERLDLSSVSTRVMSVLSGRAEVPTVDEEGAQIGTIDLETMGVLPEFSVVEGDVDGVRVTFDKRYEGTHKVTAWLEEGEEAQFEIESHLVRYEGLLDEEQVKLILRLQELNQNLQRDKTFGKVAVRNGMITPHEFQAALEVPTLPLALPQLKEALIPPEHGLQGGTFRRVHSTPASHQRHPAVSPQVRVFYGLAVRDRVVVALRLRQRGRVRAGVPAVS